MNEKYLPKSQKNGVQIQKGFRNLIKTVDLLECASAVDRSRNQITREVSKQILWVPSDFTSAVDCKLFLSLRLLHLSIW